MKKLLLISLVNIALLMSCSSLGINLNNEEGRANKLKEELSKSILGEEPDLIRIVKISFTVESCKELEPLFDAFMDGNLGNEVGSFTINKFIKVIDTSFWPEGAEIHRKLTCTYLVESNLSENQFEIPFEIKRTVKGKNTTNVNIGIADDFEITLFDLLREQ